MKSDGDFEPLKVAAALHVLEEGLRDELTGEDASQALGLMRLELVRVIMDGRAWAERRGIPAGSIPEPPIAGASAEECIASLRSLAGALQHLGAQPKKSRNRRPRATEGEKTMREVMLRLRNEDAEAVLEFQEFGHAMHEVLRHFEGLAVSLRQLHADVTAVLVNEDAGGLEALCAVEESSDRASATCERIVMAFRQICGAASTWDVTKPRGA